MKTKEMWYDLPKNIYDDWRNVDYDVDYDDNFDKYINTYGYVNGDAIMGYGGGLKQESYPASFGPMSVTKASAPELPESRDESVHEDANIYEPDKYLYRVLRTHCTYRNQKVSIVGGKRSVGLSLKVIEKFLDYFRYNNRRCYEDCDSIEYKYIFLFGFCMGLRLSEISNKILGHNHTFKKDTWSYKSLISKIDYMHRMYDSWYFLRQIPVASKIRFGCMYCDPTVIRSTRVSDFKLYIEISYDTSKIEDHVIVKFYPYALFAYSYETVRIPMYISNVKFETKFYIDSKNNTYDKLCKHLEPILVEKIHIAKLSEHGGYECYWNDNLLFTKDSDGTWELPNGICVDPDEREYARIRSTSISRVRNVFDLATIR